MSAIHRQFHGVPLRICDASAMCAREYNGEIAGNRNLKVRDIGNRLQIPAVIPGRSE